MTKIKSAKRRTRAKTTKPFNNNSNSVREGRKAAKAVGGAECSWSKDPCVPSTDVRLVP